eukprot:TRINITY_DN55968_c0_g1_i1.p1 TRINITY_DN55968_c0_g1~~TRINITY_DN55968_c0_g1_i1.p1  ORF type:complete len:258 (+),score=40.32 TRINITY_DN55968_c0_g1_i1:442-1215(+)
MRAGAWATQENLARCPRHRGGAPCLPQSLFFDENYDSHEFYQNDKVEQWLQQAEAIVFVGTSCAVGITQSALFTAAAKKVHVFNLNLEGLWETLDKMVLRGEFGAESLEALREDELQVSDVLGRSEIVLPLLAKQCEKLLGIKPRKLPAVLPRLGSQQLEETHEDLRLMSVPAWEKTQEHPNLSVKPDSEPAGTLERNRQVPREELAPAAKKQRVYAQNFSTTASECLQTTGPCQTVQYEFVTVSYTHLTLPTKRIV